jgi:hypothetical protein
MGRRLKQSKSSRRRVIIRPARAGWEKWEQGEDELWSLAGEGLELEELAPADNALVAVPIRRAFSLSVWVPGADPSLFGDLVYTQLEMRGLAGRSKDLTSYVWREVLREGDEVLLHVTVLPGNLAPRYWHADIVDYVVSAECLPPAQDCVTVWQEEGAWVASVTRGDRLLHFQVLNAGGVSGEMALELMLMLAPLEAGNMTAESTRVRLFYQDDAAPDLSAWNFAGGVAALPWPPPVYPGGAPQCTPLPVRNAQEVKARAGRRQKILLWAAAAYLLVVIVLVGNALWLNARASMLRSAIQAEAPQVDAVRAAMQRWNSIESAIDPRRYPIEILYQAVRLLPEDGVRLTLFQMDLDRVVVAGEASTLQAAQRFQEELRKNPDLADYDWTTENPRPLPTGSAAFQIDGVRHGASAGDMEDADAGADS